MPSKQPKQQQRGGGKAKQVAVHKAAKKVAPSATSAGHAKHAKHKHAPGGAKGGVNKDKPKAKTPQGLAAAVGGFGGSLLQEALGDLHEAGIKVPQRQAKKGAAQPEGDAMQATPAAPAPAQQLPTMAQQAPRAPAPNAVSSLLGDFKL